MVVKDRVGRRRYILAGVPDGWSMEDLISIARSAERSDLRLKIIDHHDGLVLVRCKHVHVQEARDHLNGEGLETIVTSGTIKGAEKRALEKGVRFRTRGRRRRGSRRPDRGLQ